MGTTKRLRPTKFRLAARVPNEGARRFARWLLAQPAGAYDRLSRARGIGIVTLDRMLAGEIVPDAVLAHRIYAATRCAVAITDWDRAPEGGWFDAVAVQRRAA